MKIRPGAGALKVMGFREPGRSIPSLVDPALPDPRPALRGVSLRGMQATLDNDAVVTSPPLPDPLPSDPLGRRFRARPRRAEQYLPQEVATSKGDAGAPDNDECGEASPPAARSPFQRPRSGDASGRPAKGGAVLMKKDAIQRGRF